MESTAAAALVGGGMCFADMIAQLSSFFHDLLRPKEKSPGSSY